MERFIEKLRLSGEWRKESRVILHYYAYIDSFQLFVWFLTSAISQYRASKVSCPPVWRESLCASTIAFDMLEPLLSTIVPSTFLFFCYWKLRMVTRFNSEGSLPKGTIACIIHMYLNLTYMVLTLSRNYVWLFVFALFVFVQDIHILLRLGLHSRLTDYPSETRTSPHSACCGYIPIPVVSTFLWPAAIFKICIESSRRQRNKDGFKEMNVESSHATI
jgi:hypothetical protein